MEDASALLNTKLKSVSEVVIGKPVPFEIFSTESVPTEAEVSSVADNVDDGPTLPAASISRTFIDLDPSPIRTKLVLVPSTQPPLLTIYCQAVPSLRPTFTVPEEVIPSLPSDPVSEAKAILATAAGAVVSTITEAVAELPVLPASSVWITVIVPLEIALSPAP